MPALAELGEFRQAVADFPAGESGAGESGVAAGPAARAAAERSLAESGFLLLGEVRGVLENPLIIRALLRMFGLASLALEWPAGLAPVISAFLAGDALADHPGLWFGDGRITAVQPAVLRERAAAGPLELTLMDETMIAPVPSAHPLAPPGAAAGSPQRKPRPRAPLRPRSGRSAKAPGGQPVMNADTPHSPPGGRPGRPGEAGPALAPSANRALCRGIPGR
jgi:hypothetical protein